MAWLRLDDGFTKHPKFEGWPPAQRWAWLEVMEYCARYGTRGRIPKDLALLPRSATVGLLARAEASGWCAKGSDGALWINDWMLYNGSTIGERVAAYLAKHPEATANEVQRNVGGKREIVLAAYNELTTTNGSLPVPERFPSGSLMVPSAVPGTGSGTGTKSVHARVLPVPSPEVNPTSTALQDADDDVPAWGKAEPERARAWLDYSHSKPDVQNPNGYARSSYKAGGWPSEPPPAERTIDTLTVCKNIIAGVSWDKDTDWQSMHDEIDRLERRHGPLTPDEHHELHTLWKTERERRYPAEASAA